MLTKYFFLLTKILLMTLYFVIVMLTKVFLTMKFDFRTDLR